MKRAEEQMFKERKTKIDWKESFRVFSDECPFSFAMTIIIALIILILILGAIVDFLIDNPIYALYLLFVLGALIIVRIIFSFIKSIKRKIV